MPEKSKDAAEGAQKVLQFNKNNSMKVVTDQLLEKFSNRTTPHSQDKQDRENIFRASLTSPNLYADKYDNVITPLPSLLFALLNCLSPMILRIVVVDSTLWILGIDSRL